MSDYLGLLRVGIVIFLIFSLGLIVGIYLEAGLFIMQENWLAGNVIWITLIVDAILLSVFFSAGRIMKLVKTPAKRA